jgi:hypothetical protein
MRFQLIFLTVALLLMTASFFGQGSSPIPQPDQANLTGLTTPIEVKFSDGRLLQGSGFFYFEFGPDDPNAQGPHWRAVTHVYVVTAKHIIQPTRLKELTKFTYAMRVGDGDHVNWHLFDLNSTDLGKRLHLCKKDEIDVAVIDVTDILNTEMRKPLEQRAQWLNFNGANSDEFPGKSPIQVQPGDDLVVIGYPSGFYDQFNKLPALKTGLLNTPIGLHYNGRDAFLMDFKYREGSSGSLIISKPTHIGFPKDGGIQSSIQPQYVFLGVYEGETYWNDVESQRADMGIGWYFYNVEEAIKNPPLIR